MLSMGIEFPLIFLHFLKFQYKLFGFPAMLSMEIEFSSIFIDSNQILINFYRWELNSHQFSYTFRNLNANYSESQQYYRWELNSHRFLSI